ncbi:MAG: hypothetical protein Q7J85_10700 [Bacillota bacterium]|nr:hypothetical protein [Bacillota bacterium]
MELEKFILAIVALDAEKVGGCGTPVFFAVNKEEQDKIATYLARITEGVVHDLENGTYIVVKH